MMKAQADVTYFLGYAFGVGIAVLLLIYVFSQLFAGFEANPQVSSVPSAVKALQSAQSAQTVIGNALVVIYIFIALGSILLSFFVDSSPIFIILIIVALPGEMLMAFILHDAFFQIIQSSFLQSTAASFPELILFMQFLPMICLAMAIVIGIMTFTKR